jgi:hypothetical protein
MQLNNSEPFSLKQIYILYEKNYKGDYYSGMRCNINSQCDLFFQRNRNAKDIEAFGSISIFSNIGIAH